MKNIIIAAGYATRLYPLTENFPKPLLRIGKSTIIGRLLDDIDEIEEISEHIIVTNHKFAHHFENWRSENQYKKPVRIIDDGTTTNENRLGAVRDLLLAINKCNVNEDILVLAADNILDFSFKGFVEEFHKKGTSMIMCHEEPEFKKLQRTGVIRVDKDMKVLEMQEKPKHPVSHWAVPPFYIYKNTDFPLIGDCLSHGCGFDAPGNLAHYLVDKTDVHAWVMPGTRFDIGSMDTYKQAQEIYE
nr:sugar phosphate nucleotidyltransferase [uncultured Bacteroides sp.]